MEIDPIFCRSRSDESASSGAVGFPGQEAGAPGMLVQPQPHTEVKTIETAGCANLGGVSAGVYEVAGFRFPQAGAGSSSRLETPPRRQTRSLSHGWVSCFRRTERLRRTSASAVRAGREVQPGAADSSQVSRTVLTRSCASLAGWLVGCLPDRSSAGRVDRLLVAFRVSCRARARWG
jgi:hypothetical protein